MEYINFLDFLNLNKLLNLENILNSNKLLNLEGFLNFINLENMGVDRAAASAWCQVKK
jgi:hypothetical protein